MTEFNRKSVKAIFENAGIEIPPKDVLTELCDLHLQNTSEKDERIKELETGLSAAEQERDAAKGGEDFKKKYEDARKELADYKKSVTQKEEQAAKEKAAREYFEGKNITGKNLEIALRAAKAEIDAIELEDGKIKDSSALDALTGTDGTLAGLIKKTYTIGEKVEHPPTQTRTSGKTKDEIMAIRDDKERHAAMIENHELFGF